jgi:prolipoprotein diacylglyceryl transferase
VRVLVQTARVAHAEPGRLGVVASLPRPSSPFIFHAGALAPRWYGLIIATGIFVGWLLARRELRRRGMDPEIAAGVAMWAIPFGIVGARLYHVVTDYELYRGHAGRVFDVAAGGLGLPGVILGGALGAAIGARRQGVAPAVMFDVIAPGLIAAQAIGRWGNYFNQELFGGPTSLPWGIRIDLAHRPAGYLSFTSFQPTFLYESLWDACVLLGLLWLIPRVLGRARAGAIFLSYLAAYSAGRLVLESMRVDFAHRLLGLRVNQWVFATTLLVAGLLSAKLMLPAVRGSRTSAPGRGDGPVEAPLGGRNDPG